MDLLTMLAAKLGGEFDRQGRCHVTCPECGADPVTRGGRAAYHFYLYDLPRGQGAVCWSCGYRPRLTELADKLSLRGYTPPVARPHTPPPAAPWQADGALDAYRAFQEQRWRAVVSAWQSYKPLSEQTIRDADLGLGRVPLWGESRQAWYPYRWERLIVPLKRGSDIVGLRARAVHPADEGPKWLTASFSESVLAGLDEVGEGDTVIWCENLVDRLLARQAEPSVRYVASGGVAWRDEWLAALAQARPAHVLIWLDNDAAGCPNESTWRAACERRAREQKPAPPEPRGPRLANELLARGVRARVYRWPAHTPEHADLAWALMGRAA